jgi:hypothetical protein
MAVILARNRAIQAVVIPDFLQSLWANTKTVSWIMSWLFSSLSVPVPYLLSYHLMLCTRPDQKLTRLWKLTILPWWQANFLWNRYLLLVCTYSSASFTAQSTSHSVLEICKSCFITLSLIISTSSNQLPFKVVLIWGRVTVSLNTIQGQSKHNFYHIWNC